MHIDGLDDGAVREILLRTRRIALVGASMRPQRPSFEVMGFLLRRGYEVTPVNPGLAGQQIHGRTVVGDLQAAVPLDMVELFRASAHVAPFVEQAVRLGACTVWMQLGIVDAVAGARAAEAGLRVVMDRCPAIEYKRLGLDRPAT